MSKPINSRTVAAGAIGNVLEWYDFSVYGFLAPVLAAQFFPTGDPLTSLIAAFGVFAAGYLMRPIGGMVIGHIGDRIGRRPALILSIVLMAVPTGLIALLPTHASIGVAAAVLLTLLRLLQGFSVGGEYGGSVIFLGEQAPTRHRGLVTSVGFAAGSAGVLLGSAVAALLASTMSSEALNDWGWRLAFVPGPILGVIGFLLRRQIAKDDQASGLADRAGESPPIIAAVRDHAGGFIRIVGITASVGVVFYTAFVYLSTYLSEIVKVPRAEALDMNTVAMAVMAALMPVFAVISDRVGRRPVMIISGIALAVLAYPLFLLLHSGNTLLEQVGDFTLAILIGAYTGPFAAITVEQLPHRVRYSGVSVGFSIAMGVFGGTTPLVATWLILETGSDLSPAFYLMAFMVLGVVTLFLTPETAGRDLD